MPSEPLGRERIAPCPFCGGDADVRMHDWRVSGAPVIRYAVDCPKGPKGRGGCGAQTAWYPTKAEAVAAWNRRAQPADDSSLRCSCEWAHAATGDVDTDWPAELDPHCAVHADAQPAERPQRIEAYLVEVERTGGWKPVTGGIAGTRFWPRESADAEAVAYAEDGYPVRVVPLVRLTDTPVERPQRKELACGCTFEIDATDTDAVVKLFACIAHDGDDVEWPRIAGAYLTDAPEEG